MNGTRIRSLSRGGARSPAQTLRDVADALGEDAEFDLYGEGALVAELENEVAALLGKEAAVFSISGRIAQLAALRVHADRRGRVTIAAHPRSHIVEDENDAAGTLFGLHVARVGSLVEPFTCAELAKVTGPLGAVTVELPLRRVAYTVPTWSELVAIAAHARERGAAFHLDGARLWEAAPGFGRTLAEICALADTVYVSLYKGLGGLAGAVLAGDAATIAAARTWLGRAGAVLFRATPYVVAARLGLARELPLMSSYYEKACALAAALREVDGIAVRPETPACNAFAVYLEGTRETLSRARDRIAERLGIELFAGLAATPHPGVFSFELIVGTNALALETSFVRCAFEEFSRLVRGDDSEGAASAGIVEVFR